MNKKIALFLQNGGQITHLPPKYKGFKKPKEFCQKCEVGIATKKFSDGEGNRYNWCKECYDE